MRYKFKPRFALSHGDVVPCGYLHAVQKTQAGCYGQTSPQPVRGEIVGLPTHDNSHEFTIRRQDGFLMSKNLQNGSLTIDP